MSDIEFTSDPRLPPNVLLVETDADGEWFFEFGVHEGDERAKAVDLRGTDADDPTVTQLSYEFVERHGVYVHDFTGVHRHGPDGDPEGGHGECEHAPPEEYPATEVVRDIIIEGRDAPVAGPDHE